MLLPENTEQRMLEKTKECIELIKSKTTLPSDKQYPDMLLCLSLVTAVTRFSQLIGGGAVSMPAIYALLTRSLTPEAYFTLNLSDEQWKLLENAVEKVRFCILDVYLTSHLLLTLGSPELIPADLVEDYITSITDAHKSFQDCGEDEINFYLSIPSAEDLEKSMLLQPEQPVSEPEAPVETTPGPSV